ncbi:MAG: hypothetical protein ABW208_07355 [Pyrinomonadaceae bacterium]
MKAETVKAFDELRRALAKQLGANPDELVMMISRPHDASNGHCARCHKDYFDESGCDPCPHCGASYFDQIFPGLNCRKRLPMIKRKRRAARRAALNRRAN